VRQTALLHLVAALRTWPNPASYQHSGLPKIPPARCGLEPLIDDIFM